jgi:hypothetical protein
MTLWTIQDISFDFVDDMTDDPIVTLRIFTPIGPLTFMAQPEMVGATMVLKGLHAQDSTANAVGKGNLMVIARAMMEGMDLDGLVIEGAVRSTGANPGHRPRNIRFTRRIRPAPGVGRPPSPDSSSQDN